MDTFEILLAKSCTAVERFVRYRVDSKSDADDILQVVYLTAFRIFSQLTNKESFRAWILRIAKNKCADYFKQKARQVDIPIGTVKSRLHAAKQNFKLIYPYPPKTQKGEIDMKTLPMYLPEYSIV